MRSGRILLIMLLAFVVFVSAVGATFASRYATQSATGARDVEPRDDPSPSLSVTKSADPETLAEPGGEVTYTVVVSNTGPEAVELTGLVDDRFGDLGSEAGLPATIAAGEQFTHTFTREISGNAGDVHRNTVTASAVDDEANPVEESAAAEVTFTDVSPSLSVTKSADPVAVPESGGDVTFTVTVRNDSVEPVTLGTITDKVGDGEPEALDDLDPAPPAQLEPGATYAGTFTRHVAGDYPGSLTDVVTVTAVDDEGNPASAGDDATVSFIGGVPRHARGEDFSLVVKTDGSLWSWGDNAFGQLGLGDTTLRVVANRVGSRDDWATVACGDDHALGVRSDGSLWAWGLNGSSQLGLGDTTNRLTPTRVGTDTDWAAVACGDRHSMALKRDGSLWTWGDNSYGQLGLGDQTPRSTPTRVGTDDDWALATCGAEYSAALKSDRTLWMWGRNLRSQLGLGDAASRLSPTRLGDDADWTHVRCGDEDTRALKSDGSLWAWGANAAGQLGLGDTVNRTTPTRVGMDNDWTDVSCGDDHTLAVRGDGSLWACGANSRGQLGQGHGDQVSSLVRVGSESGFGEVVCGDDNSAAFKDGNALWNWGDNELGQLSMGDTTNRFLATFAFFVDDATGPPIDGPTSATHPDADAWYADADPSFAWSAADDSNIAGYKYVLDLAPGGEAPQGYPSAATTTSYTNVAEGSWYFHVRAVDRGGNWGPTATRRVRIDMTPPETTDNADGNVYQAFTVQLTADDALSGVTGTEYRVDGGAWADGSSVTLRLFGPPKRKKLRPGVHTVEYRSADAAGNVEATKSCQIELQWLRVAVLAPNGGESIPQDSETDVEWSLSRPIEAGWFDLWVTSPTTGSFKLNADPIAVEPDQTDYSFHWTVAHPPADDYRLRVIYDDGLALVTHDDSDGDFSITSLPQTPDARELVALGTHAYVAAGAAGLQIYDIADPDDPRLLGTCDTRGIATDVSVAGDHAYVADGAAGLEVVDVSDPAAPRVVGNVVLPDSARRLALSTGRLLEGFESASGWAITAGELSLDGAHVQQGTAALKATVPPSQRPSRVDKGGLDWDLSRDHDGVELWVHLRSVGAPVPSGDGSLSLRVYLSNNSGNLSNAFYTGSNFTAHEGWNLLRFAPDDWRTIGSPTWNAPIRRMALDITTPDDRGFEVCFDDLRVGVTGVKTAFLWTFDDGYEETYDDVLPYLSAADQAATLYVRTKWIGSGGSKLSLEHLQEIYDAGWAVGNHTADHVNLTMLDKAAAKEQIQMGRQWLLDHGFTRAARHFAYPFNATNDTVVEAAAEVGVLSARNGGNRNQQLPLDDGLRLTSFGFDESTPSLDLWQRRIARAAATRTNLIAYCHTFDETTLPVFQGIVDHLVAEGIWCPTVDEWWDTLVAQSESAEMVAGRYVYVACGEAGVQVVDVGDPAAPVLVGRADTPGSAADVAVAGSIVSTADGAGGLQVVDATAPAAPAVVGASPASTGSLGAFARGGLTYLAEGGDGLRIVSLADPSAPETLGSCDTPGDARDVVIVGDRAYVADGAAGVQIVDVSDPANPAIVGAAPVTGEAEALVVFGGRAYVATGDGGLQIVSVVLP